MEDFSKRAPFKRVPITPDGKNRDLKYCGDCLNFAPSWEGSEMGRCIATNTNLWNSCCCSSPDNYKPIAGHQVSLFD